MGAAVCTGPSPINGHGPPPPKAMVCVPILTSTMKISRLSGVTLTSKLSGGNLTSSTKAGLCFISYVRHTSFTARVS